MHGEVCSTDSILPQQYVPTASTFHSQSPTTLRARKKPNKPEPVGHESFLKALEKSAASIIIEKASTGEKIKGVVKHSDKFTISIEDAAHRTRVIFKHDISEFEAVTPRQKTAQE